MVKSHTDVPLNKSDPQHLSDSILALINETKNANLLQRITNIEW